MRLGLSSAAVPRQSGDEVLRTPADLGFAAAQLAAWPAAFDAPSHVDVTKDEQADRLRQQADKAGVAVSAFSCYANPLDLANPTATAGGSTTRPETATSTGAPCSQRWARSTTTATSRSNTRTPPTPATPNGFEPAWSFARRNLHALVASDPNP